MKKEERISKALSRYIKLKYPNVVFTCDASGVRLNMGQAVALKAQRSVHKIPDMIILEPKGAYHGLILELKVESPYLKDGSLSKNKHIQEQKKTLSLLCQNGYYARFATGLDESMKVVDNYMSI